MKKKIIGAAVRVASLALVFGIVMGGRGLLAAEGQQEEENRETTASGDNIYYIGEDGYIIHSEGSDAE